MYYVADFETLTADAVAKLEHKPLSSYKLPGNPNGTREMWSAVWAWAVCPTTGPYDMSSVTTGTDIDSFFAYIDKITKDGDTVYFHNFTFDGTFILSWLIDHGYESVDYNPWNRWKKGYSLLSGELAGYYCLEVTLSKHHFKFVDSLKLLPFSVYEIGKSFGTKNKKLLIDYDRHSVVGAKLTKQEKEYVANDVLVVAEAIQKTYLDAGMTKITVGSNAMNDYIEMIGGKDSFRDVFPELDADTHNFISKAYRGGISYVKESIAGKKLEKKGIVLDVHSMYPSVMHSKSKNRYPYGQPHKFTGVPDFDNTKLWIAKVSIDAAVKKEHMPCIQIKKSGRFADNEFIKDTDGIVDIYVTSVDWEIIKAQYDIFSCAFIEGYWFDSKVGMFDHYIDKWYHVKSTTKGAEKQRAKLMLNSFYGKFATSTDTVNLIPYLDKNGILKHTRNHSDVDSVFIPVGAFVTAYARKKLIGVVQSNWNYFTYCDTDSAHLLCDVSQVKNAIITDSELNTWGVESEFVAAKYLRQKTYIEQAADGHMEVRCAGLPKSHPVQHSDKVVYEGPREHVTFDNFSFDYDFASDPIFNKCKLQKVRVRGGIVFVNGPFSIRER